VSWCASADSNLQRQRCKALQRHLTAAFIVIVIICSTMFFEAHSHIEYRYSCTRPIQTVSTVSP